MNRPYITVLLGTARKGRKSERVARYIMDVLTQRDDAEYQLVDVRDHNHGVTIPPWEKNESTAPWRNIVSRSDAFVFVVPEYNHGYPGELKMLLDQEVQGYSGKPVVLAGVSKGELGGARVIEHIQPVLSELGLVYIPYPIRFANVEKLFSDEGTITDDAYERRVNRAVDNLHTYIHALAGIGDRLTGHK